MPCVLLSSSTSDINPVIFLVGGVVAVLFLIIMIAMVVITSYSIHYTKLYEMRPTCTVSPR